MVKVCVFVRVCVREGGERYGVCESESESKRKEEIVNVREREMWKV